MAPALSDMWTAAGVILGFQLASFSWRLAEENKVGQEKGPPWLVPADVVNLAAMVLMVVGVFVLPTIGHVSEWSTPAFFGSSVILFVGHAFAMAGHYQMYAGQVIVTRRRCAVSEAIAIAITLFVTFAYAAAVYVQSAKLG